MGYGMAAVADNVNSERAGPQFSKKEARIVPEQKEKEKAETNNKPKNAAKPVAYFGEWAPGVKYESGALVLHGAKLYLATGDPEDGSEPLTAKGWTPIGG
jgi:hypothetical protein